MPLLKNLPGKSLCINIDWILKFHIFLNSIQWNTESLRPHEETQLVILVLKGEIKTDSLRQNQLHCLSIIITNCK